MKLSALRLHNVRRFAGRGIALENIGDGVNVLCEVNEYGKSTCFDALHALFFQPHTGTPGAVQALRPYSGGNPLVEADITTNGGRYRLSKQFYGGRKASVTDLNSGRLLAQADEAEVFISGLVRGGTAGPAGLLWVRQGNTGLERRSKPDDDNEKRARESVLSSVQGEVESVTGGRRMAEIMAACEEELARWVTGTLRPKAGGPYHAALELRDRLVVDRQRLEGEVRALHDALAERRKVKARLAELDVPEDDAAHQAAILKAESLVTEARLQSGRLEAMEADAALKQVRHDAARDALGKFREAMAQVKALNTRRAQLADLRDAAHQRQGEARSAHERAASEVEHAERIEREARDLLDRLDRAMRARDAAERLKSLRESLTRAEAARTEIEEGEAAVRALSLPQDLIEALETLEPEIAGLRAVEAARSAMVRMDYAPGAAAGAVTMGDVPLADGEDRPLKGAVTFGLGGLGRLTVRPARTDTGETGLADAESKRRRLLEALGVTNLAAARSRHGQAKTRAGEVELARQRLAQLAPEGMDQLREEIAGLAEQSHEDLELKGDPAQARQALDAASARVTAARRGVTEINPASEQADAAFLESETGLAAITVQIEALETVLGPATDRAETEQNLAESASEAAANLALAKERITALRASSPDLETAEAALRRARSVLDAVKSERTDLLQKQSELNGRVQAQAGSAVEENLAEITEACMVADDEVKRFETEVAILTRLREALNTARTAAREQYFEPVMTELRPLMGLLFEDASVVFDDETLLPSRILRNGLEEPVTVLSGGMREQLAVLTRLAFARLLAREGRPAPVILDDALVYSDDDRIEKMFDALHRQSKDQQIIVFSCRQRAFSRLGGNRMQFTNWIPS